MRLTTKIILGVIISVFLLSFSAIIYISFQSEGDSNDNILSISQENITSVDIEPYKTILIDEEIKEERRNFFPAGMLYVKPVINEEEMNKLFLPEELLRYTDITSSNDTLIIRLKIDELYKKYITAPNRIGMYMLHGVNFFIHPHTVDVICNIGGIKVDIRNIKTDIIHTNTNGGITIDSCQVNLIEPNMNKRGRLLLTNSQVKELNIDLDNVGNTWQIVNCDIEVENLTGGGQHRVTLPKSEAKIMNWLPKNKSAQLTVTLQGDTARVVF